MNSLSNHSSDAYTDINLVTNNANLPTEAGEPQECSRITYAEMAAMVKAAWNLGRPGSEIGIAYTLTTDSQSNVVKGKIFPSEEWLVDLVITLVTMDEVELKNLCNWAKEDPPIGDLSNKQDLWNAVERDMGMSAQNCEFSLCCLATGDDGALEPFQGMLRVPATEDLVWLAWTLGNHDSEELHLLYSKIRRDGPVGE